VPALIADAGDQAAWRYLEFFANIRNPNTRRAYARACHQFFAWCDERGLTLMTIRPVDVARYIETRLQTHSAPDVKQQLAAVRMLFNWLITGKIVPLNPAAAVRGPRHVGRPVRRRSSMARSGARSSRAFRPKPCATCVTVHSSPPSPIPSPGSPRRCG
jgi:site-specific recombinase XerC